jgi:FixJ family two-component response regulator
VSRIFIIDPDYRRRAFLHRRFTEFDCHAEIYESCREFSQAHQDFGLIFVSDEQSEILLDWIPSIDGAFEVIVYSEQPQVEGIVKAMKRGAADFLEYPIDRASLSRSFADAAAKHDANLEAARKRSGAQKALRALTRRELEVLRAIIEGGSNKSIARDLGISDRTVEIHRANVLRKLDASSTSDAVRIGLYGGLDKTFAQAA